MWKVYGQKQTFLFRTNVRENRRGDPETQAGLGTQETGWRQKKTKNNTEN